MGCLGDRDVCMINQSVQGNWLIEYSETIQRISLDASYGEGDWEEKNEHSFISAVASLVSHAVNATWEFLGMLRGLSQVAPEAEPPLLIRARESREAKAPSHCFPKKTFRWLMTSRECSSLYSTRKGF